MTMINKTLMRLNAYHCTFRHNELGDDTKTDFAISMNEDIDLSIRWLFYIRDVRGAFGYRNLFIELYKLFYIGNYEYAVKCLKLIPEFGRWKDLVDLAFTKVKKTTSGKHSIEKDCMKIIIDQLKEDTLNMEEGKPISLLAKWLPSVNASSKARRKAKRICYYLEIPFVQYRKMLSEMRAYLNVTETKISANKWNEIDYNKIPAGTDAKYNNAFLKHDKDRRVKFLVASLNEPPVTKKVEPNGSFITTFNRYDKVTETMHSTSNG